MKNKKYISILSFLWTFTSLSFLSAYSEKEFVVITPTSKNVPSILNQDYTNFKVLYLANDLDNNEFEALQQHNNINKLQIRTIQDNKIGFEGMFWHAIHQLSDDTIVLVLEEHDKFACPSALHELNQYYQDNHTWMTCGFLQDFEGEKSSSNELYTILSQAHWRNYCLRVEQPKTFYAWLFKQIKLEHLLSKNNFFKYAFNHAYLYPMLEMAKKHTVCVDKQYIASEKLEPSENVINEFELISKLPPYESLQVSKKTLCKKEQADLVVFSFDRPLQLYAFLESVGRYLHGVSSTTIVYRTSKKVMAQAYKKVKKRFPNVHFIKQSSKKPRQDFKEKTLRATFESSADYVLFAVDDIVVKDYTDLSECIEYLKKTHAYGFYLRLGKNIDYCYMNQKPQEIPDLLSLDGHCFAWRFNAASYDWACPNSLDMTLYCKATIKTILQEHQFTSPNYMEGYWPMSDMSQLGLCFDSSKIVNLPLNRVQNDSANKHLGFLVGDLLHKFNNGMKMDINPLFQVNNNSPHMAYVPTFIPRE